MKRILLFIICIVSIGNLYAAEKFSTVSKINWLKGTVVLERVTGKKLAAWKDARISPGDKIYTKNGLAEVFLANTGIIRLKKNTFIEIPRSSKNTKKKVGKLRQRFGKLFATVKKGSSFQIETPTAVAGVRGTEFDSSIINGDTTLRGFDGRVAVWAVDSSGNRLGDPVSLIPGVLFQLQKGAAKIIKKKFNAKKARKDEWEKDFKMAKLALNDNEIEEFKLTITGTKVENSVATITGTVSGDVSKITVYANDEYIRSITPDGKTFSISFNLFSEQNQISVIAKSKSGDQREESFSLENKVSVTGSIKIIAPISGTTIGKNITVNGSVDGNIENLVVYVNNNMVQEVAVDGSSFEFSLNFEESEAIIKVCAKEDESICDEVEVEQDFDPPELTISSPLGVLYKNTFDIRAISDEKLKSAKVTFMKDSAYEEEVYPEISGLSISLLDWSPGAGRSHSSSSSSSSSSNSLDIIAKDGATTIYLEFEIEDLAGNKTTIMHEFTYMPSVNPESSTIRNGITGKIVDSSTSSGVSGAYIVILGTSYDAVTDSNGNFTIYDVPAGTYTMLIKRDNYVTGIKTVSVTEGSSSNTGTTEISQ